MKKKHLFLKSLLIYCLVLVIILGAALFVLNRFLVSYEASRPDNTAEEFITSRDRSFWLDGLQSLVDAGFSEFTAKDADLSDFGIDTEAEIRWRSGAGDDSRKEYEVRLGSKKICTLSLSPAENVGFGMNSWQVSGYEFTMPGGSDITVSVPTGCTLEVNGVPVSGSYIKEMGSISLSLEHSFDIPPAAEIYEIKGMMGPAEIKSFSPDGAELRAETVSENHVEFLPEPANSFAFCALSDSEVYINGEEISGRLCSAVDIGLDTGDSILRYECSGLYGAPEIKVLHDGAEVSPVSMPFGECYIDGAGSDPEGKMADFIEGFIYAYVDFSANKNRSADANFAVLAQYLDRDSELYTLTANTIENIAWASTSGLEYNSISYSDLIPLGGGRYVCSIYYDISYTLGVNELDVQTGNLILIEEVNGGYCVSAMAAGF